MNEELFRQYEVMLDSSFEANVDGFFKLGLEIVDESVRVRPKSKAEGYKPRLMWQRTIHTKGITKHGFCIVLIFHEPESYVDRGSKSRIEGYISKLSSPYIMGENVSLEFTKSFEYQINLESNIFEFIRNDIEWAIKHIGVR